MPGRELALKAAQLRFSRLRKIDAKPFGLKSLTVDTALGMLASEGWSGPMRRLDWITLAYGSNFEPALPLVEVYTSWADAMSMIGNLDQHLEWFIRRDSAARRRDWRGMTAGAGGGNSVGNYQKVPQEAIVNGSVEIAIEIAHDQFRAAEVSWAGGVVRIVARHFWEKISVATVVDLEPYFRNTIDQMRSWPAFD